MVPSGSPLRTISDLIDYHAGLRPQWPAIVGTDFDAFSFQELSLHIRTIKQQLQAAGVKPSARVGILLPKGPEATLLGLSIAASAICVPINPMLNPRELEEELPRLGLDAVILPTWQRSPAWELVSSRSFAVFEVSKVGRNLSETTVHLVRKSSLLTTQDRGGGACSTALLLRTSGTTGAAKLVPVTHRNLLAMASKMQLWFNLSAQDRCACILPAYYAQGYKSALLVPLLLGGSVALPTSQDPGDVAQWIGELRPTWFSAGPTYLRAMLDKIRAGDSKLAHSLRFILSSSSYLPEFVRAELETLLGIPILEFYGLSEAGVMAANPMPPAKRKPGTVGVFPPDELAIRSEARNILGIGEVGEIVVRGPSVSPGAVNGIEGPHFDFRRDWLETGDVGFIDPEGFLTIVGRTKEIINRGGEKIAPYEIEKALLDHPFVADAAAFSVPHARLGENVAAAVVLKPQTKATSSELKTFLYDRLAHFKVPQRIVFVSDLPRGSTGKISRSNLATAVANQVRAAIPPGSMLEFQIAEIWQGLLGRTDLGVDDDFFELGGDSLLATNMIVEVETATGQRIPRSSLGAASTIRDLANALMHNVPANEEMVTCVHRGTTTPFFYCHGDFLTRGFYGLRLGQLLGPDQPVYLLHPPPLSKLRSNTSIEAIAESYVPHLLAAQPNGAFRLGGFCNGGLLAWEIARQLFGKNRQVELVVIIDTISLNARPTFRALERTLRALKSFAPAVKHDMCAIWKWARQNDRIDPLGARADAGALRIDWHVEAYQYAAAIFPFMCHYIPQKIDCEVYCVLCEEYQVKKEYSPSAWQQIAGVVHRKYIPGAHHNCVTTHLDSLAKVLRGILPSPAIERGTRSRFGRS